jgi:hypothetical protein
LGAKPGHEEQGKGGRSKIQPVPLVRQWVVSTQVALQIKYSASKLVPHRRVQGLNAGSQTMGSKGA